MEDYEQACLKCEQPVLVDDARATQIRAALAYDKRRSAGAPRGRAVAIPFPSYGLVKYDRLEPSRTLFNVANFEAAPKPLQATFWRRSEEGLTRHRN
eukprot:13567603-Alexandrium_andersonii.AAC.1